MDRKYILDISNYMFSFTFFFFDFITDQVYLISYITTNFQIDKNSLFSLQMDKGRISKLLEYNKFEIYTLRKCTR